MAMDRSQRNSAIGAAAGAAIGLTQMRAQGYDFSQSQDVSRAIGFLLGFALAGGLIGYFSSRKGRSDNEFDPEDDLEA